MKHFKNIERIITCALLVVALCMVSCVRKVFDLQETIPIVSKVLNDSSSVYYVNFEKLPSQRDTLPIGVVEFDGYLPMTETLLHLEHFNNITGRDGLDRIPDLAGEKFQTLLDLENLPYQDYVEANKSYYLREIVVKNALFLLSNKYYLHSSDKTAKGVKDPCKIIVVSSPWASAYGVSDIEQLLRLSKSDVKVVGVIRPTVRTVYEDVKRSNNDSVAVGILDSYGEAYLFEEALNKHKKHSEESKYLKVVTGNLKELTAVIDKEQVNWDEESLQANEKRAVLDSIINSHIRSCIVSLLDSLQNSKEQIPLKSLILGSWEQDNYTPRILSVIEELRHYTVNGRQIYAHLIDKNFTIINPLECAARECYRILRNDNLLAFNPTENHSEDFKSVANYTVGTENLDSDGKLTREFKLSREVGKEEETTVIVKFE